MYAPDYNFCWTNAYGTSEHPVLACFISFCFKNYLLRSIKRYYLNYRSIWDLLEILNLEYKCKRFHHCNENVIMYIYVPFLRIAWPQSQFLHSCACEQFIYSQDRSTRNIFSGNIYFEFSVLVLCSALMFLLQAGGAGSTFDHNRRKGHGLKKLCLSQEAGIQIQIKELPPGSRIVDPA